MDQSLALFQKRDELDDLEGFQQQELSKVKHMVLKRSHISTLPRVVFDNTPTVFQRKTVTGFCSIFNQLLKKEEQLSQQERQLHHKEAELHAARRNLSEVQGTLQVLKHHHEESCSLNAELEIER